MTAFGVTESSLPYKGKVPSPGSGTSGKNAFTVLTANFTQPAVGANGTASVADSTWAAVGQIIFVAGGGGYYTVVSKPTTTSIELTNLGAAGFSSPGTPIPSASQVSPAGPQGPGSTQLAFGNLFTIGGAGVLNGTETYFDINGVIRAAPPDNRLGGLRINEELTIGEFSATMATLFVDATVVTVTALASIDDGQTYDVIATVTLQSGQQTDTALFGPTVFPVGTLFCCGAITDGGNFAGGLSCTLS